MCSSYADGFAETAQTSTARQLKEADSSVQEKIALLEKILKSYSDQVDKEEAVFLERENKFNSYEEVLQQELYYLQKRREFEEFLEFYRFLQDLKELLHAVKEAEAKIYEGFSFLDKMTFRMNEINRRFEEVEKAYDELQDKRGILSLEEMNDFIDFMRRGKSFSANSSLRGALEKTVNDMQSIYEEIDEEIKSLKQRGYLLASLVCDSDFYKSYRKNCLPIFSFQDRRTLEGFADSLGPDKWRKIYAQLKNTLEYKEVAKAVHEKAFEEALWLLAQDNTAYSKLSALWQTADFYRWVYFTLKNELDTGVDSEINFSWRLLLNALENQQEKKQALVLEFVKLHVEEKRLKREKNTYIKELASKEEEYFFAFNGLSVSVNEKIKQFSINLEETDIACLEDDLNTALEWNDCINRSLSFISSQESAKREWELSLSEKLSQIVSSSIAVINDLKSGRE